MAVAALLAMAVLSADPPKDFCTHMAQLDCFLCVYFLKNSGLVQ